MSNQKRILITGSTDGIGKITAEYLADKDHEVIIHGRDENKCKSVKEEIVNLIGNNNINYYVADLSSIKEIKSLAKQLNSDLSNLDVLINNAGVGIGPDSTKRRLSTDGYELCFAVNYLAPYLLTNLILPLIEKAEHPRIVNVASVAQHKIDFDNVMLERDYDGHRAYSQSKLALIMFTFDLAEKLKDKPITVNAMHPGTLLDTNMVREGWGKSLGKPERGADNQVYLALSEKVDNLSGQYFDEKTISKANQQAYDKEARQKLDTIAKKLTAL